MATKCRPHNSRGGFEISRPKLNNCPFCGGKADIEESPQKMEVYIRCQKCGIRTEKIMARIDYCAQAKAASMWNRRVNPWCPTGQESADEWYRNEFIGDQDE